MTTSLPVAGSNDAGIDYELFLDCVHCGLCTSACPTYLELGDENDGPRGRIYLMRAATDGRLSLDDKVRGHLDLCLDCRACESACPSGVQYGRLIEPFRLHLAKARSTTEGLSWLMRVLLFGVATHARRLRLALAPAWLMQQLRLDRALEKSGLLRLLPASLQQMFLMLPRLQRHYGRLPEVLPAEGTRRARVILFTGCAADAFFPNTNVATARVLQKNGCEVLIPRRQVCCGALHYHAAQEAPAKSLAARNLDVFGADVEKVDAVIVNAAGCGAMLKDYGHLLYDERAKKFAAKVMDVHEFLAELGPVAPEHPLRLAGANHGSESAGGQAVLRSAYHDACHLCHGQQIRQQPRQLLQMIPGLQLLPLAENEVCCGAAGSYNISQPEMAERLGQRKAKNIALSGADIVFTANVGCILQIARHLRRLPSGMLVAHPVDALWASYSNQPLICGQAGKMRLP